MRKGDLYAELVCDHIVKAHSETQEYAYCPHCHVEVRVRRVR